MNGYNFPEYREVNSHIHTPFSFSAFDKLETVFSMARDENISVLGINDFIVTDGYEAFNDGCIKNKIFPLFNIEFIGLLKEEQKNSIRINDPNNPGRIYFSGKGLDFPYMPGWMQRRKLNGIKKESQNQIRYMIGKINQLIEPVNPVLSLTYEDVRRKFAQDLVRERHLARAIRQLAVDNYATGDEQLSFIESLYGDKKSKAGMNNATTLENEIRSNLLKAGGTAFVQENDSSFPELRKIMKIIVNAGGIPCYPVLLDDPTGALTEFEADKEKLDRSLSGMGIACIELIPGRNELSILRDFVEYFDKKEYIITFGTEHNTPDIIPLTITARGSQQLDGSLKSIGWKGACVIAAHQYLRAHGRQGYVLSDGTPSRKQKEDLTGLGQMVIEYFLNNKKL